MHRFFSCLLALGLLATIACNASKDLTGNNPAERAYLSLEERLMATPGVFVNGTQIRVRGGDQSFFADSEPLFVVNGQAISGGYASVRTMFGPMDIKSVRVLKRPEELAMYGSRGMNGVIKIRLRNEKGSEGETF